MTEHVLNYDHSPGVEVQSTYYWCGPTSTEIVLNGRGVIESQQQLASEIGTTVDGTAYVGLIEAVLNNHLPDAHYASVYVTDDPPTPAEKETLWTDIVTSINNGYGCVINIEVPPSNYPVGVKGSATPAYGGGTVYHYIAAMGYDDDPALRAVWIADPGFRPFGYWVALDQLITMIPPKGYTAAQPIVIDPWEVFMATNQEKLDFIYNKLGAYPDDPNIAGRWPSRSIYRDNDNGVDDTVGMLLNVDATAFDLLTENQALMGVPAAIARVKRLASGQGPAGGNPDAVARAKAILTKIGGTA